MKTPVKNTSTVYLWLSSFFLLLVCVGIGLTIAAHKPLWGDEILSLNFVVRSSYASLLSQPIPEGNVCHLFYLLQKVFCDLAGFSLTPAWDAGHWTHEDPYAWMIVRLNPVIFMSLSIVFVFYYFSRFYSSLAGWYSLMISLSSYMVWAYWAESRPYGLWIFLTTVQSLLFLSLTGPIKPGAKQWPLLTTVHFLLSLTSILSIAAIGIVSFLLWIYVERNWRRYVFLTVMPAVICILYYLNSPKYQWWFANSPWDLINASFPKDRFLIIFLFAGFLLLYYFQRRTKRRRLFEDDAIKEGIPYLILTVLMVLAAVAVLLVFKLGANTNREGFEIPGRYFIYLTPVGIIAVTLFSVQLWRAFKSKTWLQIFLGLGIGFLVLIRVLRTFALVKGFYYFH